MPRLFHPDLGREVDVPDSAAEVLAESGWEPAPEPTVRPGYQPEPVRYVPVTDPEPEPEPDPEPAPAAKKRGTKTAPDTGEDTSK